ncbi:MAG: ABC transporter ATP-binding protein [Gammaproteobacteria bacterium]
MKLLETRNLEVTIAGHRVCRDLALAIGAGECWGLLGRNGAGKTTLLHTLAGLRPPAGGAVHLDGRPLEDWSGAQRARRMGVLFQDNREVFPSTVLETVLIGRHPYLQRWQWEGEQDLAAATSALAAADLAGMEARSVATLSGGEHQRLQIATLLAQDPRLLLLDEPVNHLDLKHQMGILATLTAQARREGRALLMVLHDINLAVRFCDHLLLLYGNGETRQGRRELVLGREALEQLYDYPLRELRDGERKWFVPGGKGENRAR